MGGFSDGSSGKESTCNARDLRDVRSIPGSGRFPGEGNGSPLQYFCLENLTLKNCLLLTVVLLLTPGLPWWLSGKEFVDNAGDEGSIPGSGRFPGEGNGNPLQYPCLENPMDRGAWGAAVHGVN